MKLNSRYIDKRKYNSLFILLTIMTCIAGYYLLQQTADHVRASGEFISPLSTEPDPIVIDRQIPREDIDTWVADFTDQYFQSPAKRSEVRMIMHCLLNRESKHGLSQAHGDGGLAGGILQFHESTWARMRKQMGKPISTRYSAKDAIETTIWAIANGRAKEWGPILRDSKGNNYAACQTPSWY